MRLESLILNNYRQYQDAVFDFSKVSNIHDIHVVLGNNGTGKTNMLNAITWCLYGKETHLSDKNTALPMINSQYVADLRSRGENIGNLKVEILISSQEDTIQKLRVSKTAKFRINSDNVALIKEDLDVMYLSRDGEWKGVESEDEMTNYIHRYVPEEINEYIFFDGEQLEKYFQEQQRENIMSGIKELTQSTVLEKTADAFDRYVTSELNPRLRNCGDDEVQRCQKIVDDVKTVYNTHDDAVKEIEKQIIKFNQKIQELDTRIKGHENIKEKRDHYYALEEQADNLQKKKREKMAELMKFARDYYQYFAIYPAIKSLYNYIKLQEEEGKLPPKIDKALLEKIIQGKKCLICENDLDDKHLHVVEELQKVLELSSDTSSELNKAMTAITAFFDIIRNYPEKKNEYIKSYNEIQRDIERNQDEYKKLDSYLKSVPNNEALAKDITLRDEYKTELKKTTEKLGAEKASRENAYNKLQSAEKDLQSALEQNKKLSDIKAKIEFCNKCKVLLHQIHDEILNECRTEMQKATFDIFSQLLWKKDSFAGVEIDDDYTFRLLDIFGEQTLGSCSAAERALLALSFTLALQEISKHDSLLYIDTPIGRVDPENRENFMKVLLDISSKKQVILTFTPAEYDYNVQQLLNNQSSSFCMLKMTERVTKVER